MLSTHRTRLALMLSCMSALFGSRAAAQSGAWLVFSDDAAVSASECDIVNLGNDELIVIDGTRALETVDGHPVPGSFVEVLTADAMFTFVDADGTDAWVVANVFIDSAAFGFLAFTDDGDGLRSLWWLQEVGGVFRAVELLSNPIEPFVANLSPLNVAGVRCDACEVLVGSVFCGCTSDLECVDGDTCTDDICSADGVCVYVDTCADRHGGDRGGGAAPRISFSFCGSGASLAMSLTLVGLLLTTLVRRGR